MVAENHKQFQLLKSGETETVTVYATNSATAKQGQKLYKCLIKLPNYERYNCYMPDSVWFSKGHRMFIIDQYNDKNSRTSIKFNIPIDNVIGEIIEMEEVKVDFRID